MDVFLNKIYDMNSVEYYRNAFISYLESKSEIKAPKNLYEPISYILSIGGKRLRPILVLMATDIFGRNYRTALDAALAIEVFHNFSLVHDDIMDSAPLRRGKTTVHEKWDINTGILSGDAMLITAYQLFENYDGDMFRSLAQLFSRTAIEVCEGQQYDVDFEIRENVTLAEYLKMIEYKTAVLVAAALKMGAIIAMASDEEQQYIYDFGCYLGIAFQLQDDYLDAFGDPKTFGKQIGGDIIKNKKTYLYIKAMESGTTAQRKELTDMYSINLNDSSGKIARIKTIFEDTGAAEETAKAIEKFTQSAFQVLKRMTLAADKKQILHDFGVNLMKRTV